MATVRLEYVGNVLSGTVGVQMVDEGPRISVGLEVCVVLRRKDSTPPTS